MRPSRLVMRAFGPFAGEQMLDFDLLSGRSLFLIHGPTGAGKTTILDAICFALYGDTSGDEREGKQMRSDQAGPGDLTEVTFDFQLGDQHYRVNRRPEQTRPKKRGQGETIEPAQATLWRRTNATAEAEGTMLAGGSTRVTEEVERLLGFRSDQFRQVIMLPQGQFRQFLLADSRERQSILETLFETEFYRRIEDKLKSDAKALEAAIRDARNRRDFIFGQAEADSEDALRERREETNRALANLQAELENLRDRDRQAQEDLNRARQTVDRINETQEAEAALRELEARKDEFSEKSRALDRARKAATLTDLESMRKARAKEAKDAQEKLSDAREALQTAQKTKQKAQEDLDRELKREQERREAADELSRLRDMAPQVEGLEQAKGALDTATKALTEAKAGRDRASEKLRQCRENLGQKRQLLEATEKTAAAKEARDATVRQAKVAFDQATLLAQVERDMADAATKHAEASARLAKAETAFARDQETLAAQETAWQEGQAAVLARQLVPGVPCPVCGSTEHPSPAVSERELPSEAELKKRRTELKKLETERDRLRKEESQLHSTLAAKQAEADSIRRALGDLSGVEAGVLESRLRQAEEDLNAAEKADSQLLSLRPETELLEEDETRVQQALEESEQRVSKALEQQAGLQATVTERERNVPQHLRTTGALARAVEEAGKKDEFLRKALESAQRKATQAERDLAGAEASLTAAETAAASAEQNAADQAQRFAASLREAGFHDEQDYQTAKRDAGVMDRLESDIQQYDRSLSAATDRLKRARRASEGLQMPDMASLQATAQQARAELDGKLGEESTLNGQVAQIDRWLKQLEKISAETRVQEKQYAILGRLAEVASGRNSAGLTFQRFVLGALLDDVLIAATERLRLMSKGRFHLQRIRSRTDRRIASGLDLEVYDTYTGTTRPVSTLSGGESFLASLALSLGLADVVQSYAGGIRMETIFVDEGFGSLDPEALDLAFKALTDLQRGGRLVGIVSHVPELKERIDVRLEVASARSGSTARFVM